MIAVVGTTYIENVLREAIRRHLHSNIDANGEVRIFEDDHAPLREFGARIRMARGLGIIDNKTEDDLNWLRSIRNSFAHSVDDLTFETKAIADALMALNIRNSTTFQFLDSSENRSTTFSNQFVIAVTLMYWHLSDHKPPWGRIMSDAETRKMIATTFAKALRPKDDEPAP